MKKKILLLSALVASAAVTAQTQLPNPSFEDVSPVSVDRSTYTPPAPTIIYDSLGMGWVSGNEILKDPTFGNATNHTFAQDTTDATDGSHALLLRSHTTDQTSIFATGNSGLGVFIFNNANPFNSVKQGIPFTDQPDNFQAKYKYYNNAGDSCQVLAVLHRWNGTARENLAVANFVSTDEVTTFTDLEIPFVYSSMETPDSISVLFLSSKGGFVESLSETPVGQPGATFIIDELNLDYTASINEVTEEIANIYTINNVINVDLKESALVNIVSLNGASVYSGKLTNGKNLIELNHTGLFLVNVTVNGKTSSKKVVLK